MIKFFRKIRYDLMDKNKTGKYFKYALGEIILVVVGILIALSINNWNESQKINREEKKLLHSLNEDFIENNNRIKLTIENQENAIKYSKALIMAMSSNNRNNISSDSIATMFRVGEQSWYRAEYVTGTSDAILSSGNINILKNELLKRNLAQFSTEVKSGFEDHDESMNYLLEFNKLAAPFSSNLMKPQVKRDLDLDLVTDTNANDESANEIITNKTYLGLLINKTIIENHRLRYQFKIQGYIEKILSIIESELKK